MNKLLFLWAKKKPKKPDDPISDHIAKALQTEAELLEALKETQRCAAGTDGSNIVVEIGDPVKYTVSMSMFLDAWTNGKIDKIRHLYYRTKQP